jgi:L-alanine-DL-glutamate epimerase-like enolase superfamily enzyme
VARPAARVEDGFIQLGAAPGLGIDLDEAALARYPARDKPLRSLRVPADE